jgi:hypothetical protein
MRKRQDRSIHQAFAGFPQGCREFKPKARFRLPSFSFSELRALDFEALARS